MNDLDKDLDNEMNRVRYSGPAFGPRQVSPSSELTARVLAGTRSRPRLGWSPRTARQGVGRHLVWATPLAVAATVAAVALIPSGGGTPAPVQETLTARSVLLAAATQARQSPVTVPPPGSYVYSRGSGRAFMDLESSKYDTPALSESWLAADGKRAGVQVETFENGIGSEAGPIQEVQQLPADCPTKIPASLQPCSGPGYLGDIPEDPAGAIAFLRKGSSTMYGIGENCGAQNDVVTCRPRTDAEVFQAAANVVSVRMMSAKSRAAIFEGMSTLTGVTVIPKVTLAGHTGVGLSMTSRSAEDDDFQGTTETLLVFDTDTDGLVAVREQSRESKANGKVAQEFNLALDPLQVVTKLGVRPDGSTIKQ
jgi:hypothetical protein